MDQSAEDLLQRAATTAYERLDHDLERADAESGQMLDFIRRHLFDPRLDVGWMLAGLRLSHNVSSRFRARIGAGPRSYIEQRRLETARRLLSDTGLEVRQIGRLVGYRRFAAFSHACKRRTGQRPQSYRAAHPPQPQPTIVVEPPAPIHLDDDTRRAAGELARHYCCSPTGAVRRAVRHLHDAVFCLPEERRRQTEKTAIEDPRPRE